MRKLMCDSRVQLVLEDAEGKPLGYGRTQRTAPPQLRRLLVERDQVCCWPGCGRTDFLQAHHRNHWIDGGRTNEDELEMYCPIHHTFIHREKVRIEGPPGGEPRFLMPDGREIVSGSRPLEPEVREWFDAKVSGPLIPLEELEPLGGQLAEVAARPP
jgi:hypothetical protein